MAFDEMLHGQTPRIGRDPVTARVVKVDGTQRWVAPLDSDQRHPIGPCRGGAGAPVGAIVLLVWTSERPWIATWEEG